MDIMQLIFVVFFIGILIFTFWALFTGLASGIMVYFRWIHRPGGAPTKLRDFAVNSNTEHYEPDEKRGFFEPKRQF